MGRVLEEEIRAQGEVRRESPFYGEGTQPYRPRKGSLETQDPEAYCHVGPRTRLWMLANRGSPCIPPSRSSRRLRTSSSTWRVKRFRVSMLISSELPISPAVAHLLLSVSSGLIFRPKMKRTRLQTPRSAAVARTRSTRLPCTK